MVKRTEKEWDVFDKELIHDHLASGDINTSIVFTDGLSIESTAFLNWRTEYYALPIQMLSIVKGYIQGAKLLTRSCIENNNDERADVLIFPIMLDTVHTLEVLFKSLSVFSRDLTYYFDNQERTNVKIKGNHNVQQLHSECISELDKLKIKLEKQNIDYSEIDEVINLIKSLSVFINDIFLQTKDMSSFRYPVDNKNGSGQFYNSGSLENNKVDLVTLYATTVYIEYIVDLCQTMIGGYQDYFFTID